MKIEIKKLKCRRCGNAWYPRKPDVRRCPKCKSFYWDTERILPVRLRKKDKVGDKNKAQKKSDKG